MWKKTISPRFKDTDALQHISNIAIVDWMEVGRLDVFKLFNPTMSPKTLPLILANINVNFKAQLYYQYAVSLETEVSNIGTSSVTLKQRMFQRNIESVEASSVIVYFDHHRQKTIPLTAEIREKLAQHRVEKG